METVGLYSLSDLNKNPEAPYTHVGIMLNSYGEVTGRVLFCHPDNLDDVFRGKGNHAECYVLQVNKDVAPVALTGVDKIVKVDGEPVADESATLADDMDEYRAAYDVRSAELADLLDDAGWEYTQREIDKLMFCSYSSMDELKKSIRWNFAGECDMENSSSVFGEFCMKKAEDELDDDDYEECQNLISEWMKAPNKVKELGDEFINNEVENLRAAGKIYQGTYAGIDYVLVKELDDVN